ncbi:CDP-diacylglycerol diphosphatase [Streptomyces sp. NPDC032472]|uniref:CDP-diacylglycerol diphosphatase n=1 Tax=Streptomyces sp. NPDC032472 TaxID=3155018 RepID=UPI00340019B2
MSTNNQENVPSADPLGDDCGSQTDGGHLWEEIQACVLKQPGPCLEVESRWGVMAGRKGSTTDFQLVPTERLKGIECPKIWAGAATDYWSAAQGRIPHYFSQPGAAGLGINSKQARRQDQLHIHMSHCAAQALRDLEGYEKQQKITADVTKWKNAVLPVTGFASETRNYRVMKSPNLSGNLFYSLRHHVVGDDSRMQYQTMIVLPAKSGFYILNSESDLPSGTNTCNHLLDCA